MCLHSAAGSQAATLTPGVMDLEALIKPCPFGRIMTRLILNGDQFIAPLDICYV